LVPSHRSTRKRSDHSADCGATHTGINRGLVCAGTSNLVLGVLTAFSIVATKLLETFAGSW
jgi:hypothetical protein